MSRYLLWVGVLALVLASTGTAQAVERPFRVTGSVESLTLLPAGAPFSGSVVGTHIGQGSVSGIVGPLMATVTVSWGPFVVCYLFGPTNLILTASTGDQIFTQILFTNCQTSTSGTPFTSSFSGLYRITAGTGRFQGASGSGFLTGTTDFPGAPIPGTVTFFLEGSINF